MQFRAVRIRHLHPQMLESCEAAAWQHCACAGTESPATSADLVPEVVLSERLSLASQSAAIWGLKDQNSLRRGVYHQICVCTRVCACVCACAKAVL